MAEPENSFYAVDVAAWRGWLQANHASCAFVWLIFFKSHTGAPCIAYDDALDEALCYGWIDSLIRRLDDDRYERKFTPRTNTANWSPANRQRVLRLLAEQRMQPAGLAVLPDAATLNDLSPRRQPQLADLPELAAALQAYPAAEANWQRLAPSEQRRYLGWVSSARRSDTRAKRIAEALAVLAEGKPLGLG